MANSLTTWNSLLDDFFYQPSNLRFNFDTYYSKVPGLYEAKVTDEGVLQISINALGHDKKNIVLDVTETHIKVKSEKPENASTFVRDLNLSYKVGEEFDGTTTKATFDNGLLILTVDKKEERKAKRIKLS